MSTVKYRKPWNHKKINICQFCEYLTRFQWKLMLVECESCLSPIRGPTVDKHYAHKYFRKVLLPESFHGSSFCVGPSGWVKTLVFLLVSPCFTKFVRKKTNIESNIIKWFVQQHKEGDKLFCRNIVALCFYFEIPDVLLRNIGGNGLPINRYFQGCPWDIFICPIPIP